MGQRTNVTITREGWYYSTMLGFIVAGAIIRDINLLYIMAGIMFGPLVLSVFLAVQTLRRLQVQRRFAPLVGVGDLLVVELTATRQSKTGSSFAVVAQDRILRESDERGSPRLDSRVFFSHIPSDRHVETSYRLRLQRRGCYQLGPLKISTTIPLGLIRATSIRNNVDHVLVSPRVGHLLPAWSRRLDLSNFGGQRSVRRRGKMEGDFYAMRDWRNGDCRSWIHWRTSAKRDKLSVRQFEQRISQDLAIVLDLSQESRTPVPPREVELAVSFVATLIVEQAKHGSTHLVVASASRSSFLVSGTSSPVFRRELMEKLATVEPTKRDRLPEVLAEVLPQVTTNTKVVVVSSRAQDLQDTKRFAAIWTRASLRRMINDIVCVNTGDSEFFDWFSEHDGQATEISKATRSSAEPSEAPTT